VVRTFKTMDKCRLPAKALATSAPGTRSQRRNRISWIGNVKEDLHQRGSNIQQAAECVKDRKCWKKFVHAAPLSTTHG